MVVSSSARHHADCVKHSENQPIAELAQQDRVGTWICQTSGAPKQFQSDVYTRRDQNDGERETKEPKSPMRANVLFLNEAHLRSEQ